jgi:hypothetical protein
MNSQGQEPGAGRHDARCAARWCMSVLRAWLPTHPPTSNARMQCRCSAGCGKTISAQQNFDGLHVLDSPVRLVIWSVWSIG